MKKPKKWWIPGSVPSSKNGRRWTGKYFIASKTVVNYRKLTKEYYEKYAEEFKAELSKCTLPAKISFTFVRGTKHKFDYINPSNGTDKETLFSKLLETDYFIFPFTKLHVT